MKDLQNICKIAVVQAAPDDEALYCALGNTVDILRSMGGIT